MGSLGLRKNSNVKAPVVSAACDIFLPKPEISNQDPYLPHTSGLVTARMLM